MDNENSSLESQSNNTKFVKINEIRLSERPTLTIEEAAALYNIGENKLRELTDADECKFVLFVGRKRLIKRKQFDEYIGRSFSI
ncbi:excisionase [Butyrivibrio sp. NC2002]|uniref:excisionase n=1 Tax=Butyrivibrio sp. NC2002 TaxID=1410610 RepID=UPI00068D2F8D|nr:excisionase [Butyrivibrio sp. NC2002]